MGREIDNTPSGPQEPTFAKQRVIRVFISSTFRDMKDEREELVKGVFPRLRKMCEERSVAWGEVDLRWGITDEQKAEGKVLPICLEEIRTCRPYFIGILGERYGWIPDEIPQELIAREPWLSEHLNHSVTELEILHGVLNDPAMSGQSFFYFRDPSYVETIPADARRDFVEVPWRDDIAKYGIDDAQRRVEDRRAKLRKLKERIRGSGLPVREDYTSPRELGKLVYQDLSAVIDRLFPKGEELEPLDREAMEHEAFAASRYRVYIGRDEYFKMLDGHAHGDGLPLVVLGESGSGKSALLANWAMRYREKYPDELSVMHFIGSTPASTDWTAMLRRTMGELKRRFNIQDEIPGDPEKLRLAFANWLHMASAKGRAVIILDALNQLEDKEQALDLVWLPPAIPGNIRLILSTLPGRPLEDLNKRDWPTMAVTPLDYEERKRLIREYLAQYRKSLSETRVEPIAYAEQTSNPLYLRALLEELRIFGEHEKLDDIIDRYMMARDVPSLYEKILARFETDYEHEIPALVRDAMSLLWAARRGLSETELLDMLGVDGSALPQAVWAPLYIAAETLFVSRSGLIGFSHDYIRQAVQSRYLPSESDQQSTRIRLADYFSTLELTSPRVVDELPWQLAESQSWRRLYDLLSNLHFFKEAWQHNEFDVKAYWAKVENASQLRLVDAYRTAISGPGHAHDSDSLSHLSVLLDDTGHSLEAIKMVEFLADSYHQSGHKSKLAPSLRRQGNMLLRRGELDQAMSLYKESERIFREIGDKKGLSSSLHNQGIIHHNRGDLDQAMSLYKEDERICREIDDKTGLSTNLYNQGIIHWNRGELDQAMSLFKEGERICREIGDKKGLSHSLGSQGVIHKDRGELDKAMSPFKESERICREIGYKFGLSYSLGNQGLIQNDRGELDQAMSLYKEQERICREIGDKEGLSHSLGNQGLIHNDRGELDQAMSLYKESECLCRELGDKAGLARTLGNQGLIHRGRGELDQAMSLYKESECICRELGDKAGLARSLGNQGLIHRGRGELDQAMSLYKEQERMCREIGNKVGLARSLGSQGLIHDDRGELNQAMSLYKEYERICREIGDKRELSRSLLNQGNIRNSRGELDQAMGLLKEGERLCRELGDKFGLSYSLGYQGKVHKARGEFDQAMSLFEEQERICREIKNPDVLSVSLANQAETLIQKGEPKEALPLAQEAYQLATEHGYARLVDEIKPVLDQIRSQLKQP